MINKIYGYTTTQKQKINNKGNLNNSKVSFGVAYTLSAKWTDAFSTKQEQNFILSLMDKINKGSLKYIKPDSITYNFDMGGGEILSYTPARRGLMSNLRFEPKKDSALTGFYIIDNGKSEESLLYSLLSKSLNALIKNKSVKTVQNEFKPKNLNELTTSQTSKPTDTNYSKYLIDREAHKRKSIKMAEPEKYNNQLAEERKARQQYTDLTLKSAREQLKIYDARSANNQSTSSSQYGWQTLNVAI